MLLVLTGDKNISQHVSQEEVVYLGKWCLVNDEKHHFDLGNRHILPYPFDELNSSYTTYQYLQKVYQALLPQFVRVFNHVHHVHYSQRYWEIVIGYWLREYLEILYERYTCICAAHKVYPMAHVTLLDSSSYICPQNGKEFDYLYLGHLYNHQLYSQIISYLNIFTIQKLKLSSSVWGEEFRTLHVPKATMGKQAIKWICMLLSRWNRVYIASTYIPIRILLNLAFTFKIFPTLDTPHFFFKDKGLSRVRQNMFSTMKTTSEFEELVKATLPFNLPRIYVENYFNLKKKVKWFFPRKKAKIMLTANAYATNDGFKFWAAGQTEQYQTPFVILQHGGMSQSKWYSSEDYEKRICDYYLTYGWADKDNDKVIPFISNRLKFFNSQTVTGEVRGDILWVLNSYPRYAYSMFSGPAGSKFHDYLKEQTRFVSCLRHLTRQLLKCRPCSYEYGWHDLSYIEHHVGVLGQANARVSLGQLFKTMRLCVCTYNGTSVVEAFVANVPLIIYWNPQHVEVKDDMIDYFKTLHTLGILHFTPESAAVKVEEVKNNTFSWWERPNIQIFRKDYCERFAHASPNAAKEWGDMIKKLAKEKIT